MINFFRRIRQQLLSQNRFSKYLLYAIGEIVLVVIGILIALQVNEWNENRKEAKREKETLKSLLIELEENKEIISNCIEGSINLMMSADTLRAQIGPTSTKFSIHKINLLLGEVGNTMTCNVLTDILEEIQSSGKFNLISNDDLRKRISRWSSIKKNLDTEKINWDKDYANTFQNYVMKWISWEDIDYVLEGEAYGQYYKSKFNIDPRPMLQEPEFANVMGVQYWRMERNRYYTQLIGAHTDTLISKIKTELNQ